MSQKNGAKPGPLSSKRVPRRRSSHASTLNFKLETLNLFWLNRQKPAKTGTLANRRLWSAGCRVPTPCSHFSASLESGPAAPRLFPKKYSLLNRNVPLLNRNLASKPERKPVRLTPRPGLGAPNSDSAGVRLTSQPGFRPPVPSVPFFPCVAFPLRTHFFKKYPGLSCITYYYLVLACGNRCRPEAAVYSALRTPHSAFQRSTSIFSQGMGQRLSHTKIHFFGCCSTGSERGLETP